jgi:hypothetical protein
MKHLTTIITGAICLSLGACASISGAITPTSRMDYVDLNYFNIDCAQQTEQLEFLRAQIPGPNDKIKNWLMSGSLLNVYTTSGQQRFRQNRAVLDGTSSSIAREKINQIISSCGGYVPPLVNQGCVAIQEQFPAGHSAGTTCVFDTGTKTSRWEVLGK